jgi:phosphoglycolate phosphatase
VNPTPEDPPRFRSVVFDFDYTLADSTVGVTDCVNYALRRMDLPTARRDAVKPLIGHSLVDMFSRLAGCQLTHRFDEFKRLFTERGDEAMVRGVRLFATTRPVIDRLLGLGLTLGIVSTKFRYRIETVLRRDGLDHAFMVVIGGEDVWDPKPDPTGLRVALASLGRSSSEVLYVGDSTVDAETARRADVSFCAVLSGTTPREAFAGYPTVAIIDDLRAVPGLVTGATGLGDS